MREENNFPQNYSFPKVLHNLKAVMNTSFAFPAAALEIGIQKSKSKYVLFSGYSSEILFFFKYFIINLKKNVLST